MTWLRRAAGLGVEGALVRITPEDAGWQYSGIEVMDFAMTPTFTRTMSTTEGVLLPLSAQDVQVTLDDQDYLLTGREGVFAAVSDWLYVPLGSTVTVTATSGEIALCTARASVARPAAYVRAQDVPVEVRGSGRATRQVTNIATPSSFEGAEKIIVCEVLTPGGNVSSWPPHRHDGIGDCPVQNEEIYYFRTGRLDSPHGSSEGQGQFRVYTVDGSVDETVTVFDGDVYLVPHGYHGPSAAPPEYPMYFLNVLAGPASDRTMAFCDDSSQHWIRASWEDQVQDPRCPMTSATGRARG